MIHLERKTKIIATLGPASASKKVLMEMIRAGVDVIRLNASHQSDPTIIRDQVRLIRKCSDELEKPVGIFLDLHLHTHHKFFGELTKLYYNMFYYRPTSFFL